MTELWERDPDQPQTFRSASVVARTATGRLAVGGGAVMGVYAERADPVLLWAAFLAVVLWAVTAFRVRVVVTPHEITVHNALRRRAFRFDEPLEMGAVPVWNWAGREQLWTLALRRNEKQRSFRIMATATAGPLRAEVLEVLRRRGVEEVRIELGPKRAGTAREPGSDDAHGDLP